MRILILLALFILLFNQRTISQTYIAPMIGFDLAKIEDFDSTKAVETNLTLLEKGYSIPSPAVGLKMKKILTKNIFLSIIIEYTHKKIKANNFIGITTPKAISFNYFKNNLSANFKLGNYSVGFGGNYNLLNNIRYIYSNNITSKFVDQIDEKGIRLSVSRNINKFNIELYFNKGFSRIQDNRDKLYLNHISSIGLQLSYDLKI